MGAAQEQVVQEFMDAWGDGTQEVPDIEKILSMFSDDAVWQLWVPGGPTLQGRDAIRADIERQLRFATFMRCGPVHVTSNDRVVVTERVDEFQSKGQRVEHHLVAVFEVDGDGKIAAWREYFDPEDVNRQLRDASKAAKEARGPSSA
jgi:limonene-1,2-epoxide hydrolase